MSDEIILLLEDVVQRAWQEEKTFHKTIFKKELKETGSVCQGLSRNIFHKIFGVFPTTSMIQFEVNGKKHIIVYVAWNLKSYIIDGTIKQFLPNENGTVFLRKDYPFQKELQSGERWLV